MNIPLQITFRDVPHAEELEARVRKDASKLERFYQDIMSCRVVIDKPQRRHRTGNFYHVRIDVSVRDDELIVNREPGDRDAHIDPYVSIRDAFAAMERKLLDYAQKKRLEVKRDITAPHARVAKLFPDEEYGFIQTTDGRDIYFHKNSVLNNAFDRLKVGTEIRFKEEEGLKGPQASTVEIVGS